MILVKIGYSDKTSDLFNNVEEVKFDTETNGYLLIATDGTSVIQVPRENVRYIHTKRVVAAVTPEPEAPKETTTEEDKEDVV
jgi:hypothetical protein